MTRVGHWVLAAVLVGAVGLARPVVATQVRIELPVAVQVPGPAVNLGKIASISSSDFELVRRLVDLPIGAVGPSGRAVSIDRSELSRWIRIRTGLRHDEIVWLGESRVSVARITRSLPSSTITAAAQDALQSWLRNFSDRIEAVPIEDTRKLALPDQPARLSVRPIDYERPIQRMQVWVDVWSGGEAVRSMPVAFKVKAPVQALVALRRGGGGAPFFTEATVDLARLPRGAEPVSTAVLGDLDRGAVRLRRPLGAGQAVTAADLEPTPTVQRGEWVTLRSANGPLAIETRVEVLNDACVGGTVRVRVPHSPQTLVARVTGRSLLEINP